jgi:hypothetical protein
LFLAVIALALLLRARNKTLSANRRELRDRVADLRDSVALQQKGGPSRALLAGVIPAKDLLNALSHRGDSTVSIQKVDAFLDRSLDAEGVETFTSAGLAFDAQVHSVVERRQGQRGAPMIVDESVRPGYRTATTLLRPEDVIVRGGPPE